jgi:hypothetical protein
MDPDLVGNRPDVVAQAADPDLVLQRGVHSCSASRRKGRPSVAVRHAGAFHAMVLLATHLDDLALKRLSFGRHVPLEKCDVVGVSACTWQLGCDLEGGVFVEYLLQDFKLLGLIQGSRSGLPELSSFEASTHRSALAGLLLPGGLSCSSYFKAANVKRIHQLVLADSEYNLVAFLSGGAHPLRRIVLQVSPLHMARLVCDSPKRHDIVKYIAEQKANGSLKISSEGDEALLELPKIIKRKYSALVQDNTRQGFVGSRLKKRFDPVRLILALGFVRHLSSASLFSDALQDASEYNEDPDDDTTRQRDASRDPTRWTLDRCHAKIDVVCMALDRRWFRAMMATQLILSIHLYSDASPVVGSELQGMVADFCFKPSSQLPMRRRTLPGATLQYGWTDWVSKSMCLVWSVFLVIGPELDALTYFFHKTRSITTDYGVEIATVLICNVLPCFIHWLSGKVMLSNISHLIDTSTRLMPRCLRIGGWSHTLGNTMELVVKSYPAPGWPEILDFLRVLCRIFKNSSYRQHLAKKIKIPNVDVFQLLRDFSAGFAKWRFETLDHVLSELGALRVICEFDIERMQSCLERDGSAPSSFGFLFFKSLSLQSLILYMPYRA